MELKPTRGMPLLVLALPEESRPLLARLRRKFAVVGPPVRRGPSGWEMTFERGRVLTTGMGERNARTALTAALAAARPAWVITAGIAGGLNPELRTGDACFEADDGFPPAAVCGCQGVRPGRCVMVSRIVVSPADKARLRAVSGADLVDMESAAIRHLCREWGIPSATLRAVSDMADEALPLDFGQLTNADQQLVWWKLVVAILRAPGTIPDLLRLRRNVATATGRLAELLSATLD